VRYSRAHRERDRVLFANELIINYGVLIVSQTPPMDTVSTPATFIDETDKGDEVQRRFRYQTNYCALKALQLLAAEVRILAIYCEQIEDLLVELSDGRFCGIQIKTRELDQAPIKASDDVAIAALVKFCVKDAQFPGQFESFILVTNFVFFRGSGGDDIRNLLQCACDNPRLEGLNSRHLLRKNVESLAKSANLPVESIVCTLAKVRLEERKTGIDQPDLEVVQAIGEIREYSVYPHSALMVASRLLKARIWEASSLAVDRVILEQHQLVGDFDQHIARLRIARKRTLGSHNRYAAQEHYAGYQPGTGQFVLQVFVCEGRRRFIRAPTNHHRSIACPSLDWIFSRVF
jgi:hypothetical protein